jgi:F-type H+-transporting ATPase subunit b
MPRQLIRTLALGLGLLGFIAASIRPAATRGAEEPPAKAHGDAHGHGPVEKAVADEGGGEPELLKEQPSLAIWTLVVFLGLLFVLGRFAWKPLLATLHQREEHLEHVLYDTERARNEAESLLAEHRRLMAEAQEKVQAILDEARREAQAAADTMARKAHAEAEAMRQRAERDIASARDQALVELWSKSAELAVAAAGKVLARDLGPDEHRRLIETAMNELPAAPGAANGHGHSHS